MGDDVVSKFITASLDDDNEEQAGNNQNNFPAAIKEIGEAVFKRYPRKTSNLSSENILGMVRCSALNDYMQETYGIRYTTLDLVVQEVEERRLSKGGYGLEKFIESMKSIQASFEQHEIPSRLTGMFSGKQR